MQTVHINESLTRAMLQHPATTLVYKYAHIHMQNMHRRNNDNVAKLNGSLGSNMYTAPWNKRLPHSLRRLMMAGYRKPATASSLSNRLLTASNCKQASAKHCFGLETWHPHTKRLPGNHHSSALLHSIHAQQAHCLPHQLQVQFLEGALMTPTSNMRIAASPIAERA
jgi:hypothetical protein